MSTAIHQLEVLIVEPTDLTTAIAVDRIRSDRHSIRTLNGIEHVMPYLSGDGPYADRDRYPKPDLVILDVLLPKAKAIDLIQELAKNRELYATSVVAIYTSEFLEECKAAYDGGVRVFVSRPISPLEYNQRVREILGYWTTGAAAQDEPSNLGRAECLADRFYHLLMEIGQGSTEPAKLPHGVKEKRADPRSVYVVKGPACSVILEPMAVKGRLIDFSYHGCRIAVGEPIFETGDDVILQVQIPGQAPFQLRAVVRHCHENWVGFSII